MSDHIPGAGKMVPDEWVKVATHDLPPGLPLNLAMLRAALAAVAPLIQRAERENSWKPIDTAPQDRMVEVYAPSPDPARWHPTVHDLAPIVCLAQWHFDAGFCVCTIREVTHWREHVPPPSAR